MDAKRQEELARRLPPKLLLSTADVAVALGISDATVREMLESGALEGVNLASDDKLRPRWFVYRNSIFQMLMRRKKGM